MVAVRPEGAERVRRVLDGHDLAFVRDQDEAMRVLSEGFRMVVIDVHFDESQMFALLGDIRLHSHYRKVPVLVLLEPGRYSLSDIAVEAIDHAVKAMGANGLLDMEHFPDTEEGNARICRIVDYLILIDGDLQHIARETGDPVVASVAERRRSRAG